MSGWVSGVCVCWGSEWCVEWSWGELVGFWGVVGVVCMCGVSVCAGLGGLCVGMVGVGLVV